VIFPSQLVAGGHPVDRRIPLVYMLSGLACVAIETVWMCRPRELLSAKASAGGKYLSKPARAVDFEAIH